MRFTFTDEQLMIKKMVKAFSDREISPYIERMEEEDRFPVEIIHRMREVGLMGIPIDEKWGGSGSDFLSYIMAIEELSRVSATVGVILAVHTSVATMPILYCGSEEQKEKYLPRLTSGEYLGAFCLTEPIAGSDASKIRTEARRDNDVYWLNGSKIFITNAGEADIYITFAVTDKEKGSKGITAFIVHKDTPGFSVGKKEKKMGLHGSNTCELRFENAPVSLNDRLGEEGEGYQVALSNLSGGRIGIAAQALGISTAAFEHALRYSKERKQFDRPLSSNQGIQFKLSDMATQIEAARLLVYRAAELKQLGKSCKKEAAMAKMKASDVAMKVTTDAIQILGGYGYMKEYPVERFFRDAKITQIYEGTNEIQRIVIGKELFS